MLRLLVLSLLVAGSGLLCSCASNKPEDPNEVSSIPWNRPEKWEGQGPMGGMMGTR